jgi:hypothetical protein
MAKHNSELVGIRDGAPTTVERPEFGDEHISREGLADTRIRGGVGIAPGRRRGCPCREAVAVSGGHSIHVVTRLVTEQQRRPVIDTRSTCRARGCGPAPPGRTGSGLRVQLPVRRSPWSSEAAVVLQTTGSPGRTRSLRFMQLVADREPNGSIRPRNFGVGVSPRSDSGRSLRESPHTPFETASPTRSRPLTRIAASSLTDPVLRPRGPAIPAP